MTATDTSYDEHVSARPTERELRALALDHECPECGAAAGKRCVLRKRTVDAPGYPPARNFATALKLPHAGRVTVAWRGALTTPDQTPVKETRVSTTDAITIDRSMAFGDCIALLRETPTAATDALYDVLERLSDAATRAAMVNRVMVAHPDWYENDLLHDALRDAVVLATAVQDRLDCALSCVTPESEVTA